MPIRFRCSNCDQFMGIARRKAGSMVRCPACQREIAVPADADDDSPKPVPALAQTAPRADLFDRDDFDALLKGSVSMEGPRTSSPVEKRPIGMPPFPPVLLGESKRSDLGPNLAASRGGIVLSPRMATTLSVVGVLLLALAFALGLLVGRLVL